MAIKFIIPAIKNKVAYEQSEIPLVLKKVQDVIRKNFSTYIAKASKYNSIPKEIIESFIFIESAGNDKALSGAGAVGLMQLTPQTANDVIRRELKSKKLTTSELAILRKHLGSTRTQSLLRSPMGSEALYIRTNDLYNPELNIMLGSAYLGQIFDKLKTENEMRLDKAIILYNRGFYTSKGSLQGSYEDVWSKQPSETKGYIVKLIAKQGLLDILI